MYIRTEQDRQNLISNRIFTILSENSLPEYSYEKEKPVIRSKYLAEIFDDTLKLFNLDRISYENSTIDLYYVKDLNIEIDTAKCGHRLKDWHKIPGREQTPPREVPNLHAIVSTENNNTNAEEAIYKPMIVNDVEKAGEDNLNLNLEYRTISPDLFASEDEEMVELKKSIDEKLKESFEIITNIKDNKLSQITSFNDDISCFKIDDSDNEPMEEDTEFDCNQKDTNASDEYQNLTNIDKNSENNIEDTINITKSIDNPQIESKKLNQDQLVDDMNKTDDILSTLEITLTETIEKVTTPINKNLNAFSASLLSNFDSLNKRFSQNEGVEHSDDSICELTFTSMKGIEHFESFCDENQDKSEENVQKQQLDEIYDLTLSENDEKILRDDNKSFDYGDIKETYGKDSKISESGDNIKDVIYDLTQSDQDFDEKIDKNCVIFSDNNLNLGSTTLMDYKYDLEEVICNKSNYADNINEGLLDKKKKIRSKYEILSDSDEDSDNFDDKIITTDPDITELLHNTIKTVNDNRFELNLSGSCSKIRKSLSFTPNSNLNRIKLFKKHATFSTPSPQKDNSDVIKRSSSSSTDFNDEVICISDEELNYSSIHSTPFNKRYNKEFSLLNDEKTKGENINISARNEDIENYSYLEKYYDDQFYTEYNDLQNNDIEKIYSPITHPRILELSNKKKTPFKETPITFNTDGLNNISTPSNDDVFIKTKNITPMPDYDNMNTPTIAKELERIGVKHLKRHRGVQILKHVYETTHPMCSNDVSRRDEGSDDDISAKRPKLMEFKSRRKLEIDANDSNLSINSNRSPGVEIVGDILER